MSIAPISEKPLKEPSNRYEFPLEMWKRGALVPSMTGQIITNHKIQTDG